MSEVNSPGKQWSGRGQMVGGTFGVRFFILALSLLNLRLTYVLTLPVVFFLSFFSPDVPATMAFHRRVYGGKLSWWRARWLVFRHFYAFAQALVDRLAVLGGNTKGFSSSFEGEDHLRGALAEGQGLLLLTAHVGNWQAAGQFLTRLNVPVNVTGFDRENEAVRKVFEKSSSADFRFIPLSGSPTDVLPLVAAMKRGEIVAMLGDRYYGGPSAEVRFMGGRVRIPVGPFVMAATARAPLVPVFNVRESGGHYQFYGFPPMRIHLPPRGQRDHYLEECAQQYASTLEEVVRKYPMQWFNFFPFWISESGTARNETS